MKTSSRSTALILAGSIAAILGGPLAPRTLAQVATNWTGAGLLNAWSTAENWISSTPAASQDLYFGLGYDTAGANGLTTSRNDSGNLSLHRIFFENASQASGGDHSFTITGDGFTLLNFTGGLPVFPQIANLSTLTQTVNLGSGQVLTFNDGSATHKAELLASGGNLVFSATTGLDLAGTTTLSTNAAAGRTITISGVITSSGGVNGLSNVGAGMVILEGANLFTGPTVVSAGTLQIGSGGSTGALSTTSAISVASGATLSFKRSNSVAQGVDFSAAPITGAGSLNQAGSGTLLLNGNNTYSGGSTLSGGTVVSGARGLGSGTVNVATGATLSASQSGNVGLAGQYFNITPATNGSLNPNFVTLGLLQSSLAGTTPSQVLNTTALNFAATGGTSAAFPSPYNSGAANFESFYSGKINIATGGTYTFNTTSDDGSVLFIDGNVVVNNNLFQASTTKSATIALTPGYHDITVGYFQGTSGYNFTAQISGPDTANVLKDISSANGIAITPDLIVGSLSGAGNVVLSTGNLITGQDNTSTTFSGVISDIGALNKWGSGTLSLSGANTYAGATVIAAGKLQLGAGGTTGSLPTGSAISVGTGATLTFNRSDTVTQGTEFSAAPISGAGSLSQTGSGTLVLNVANTYTGGTTLAAGIVLLNNAAALGTSGTLNFAGGTLQYGSGISTDLSARFGTVSQAFKIDTNGQNVTFASAIGASAANTLTKLGAGKLTLTVNSAYTGATVINGGTLSLSGGNVQPGALSGTPTITINAGGILELTNSDTIGYTAGKQALIINSGGQVLNNGVAKRDTLSNTVVMTGGILGGSSAGDGNGAFSFGVANAITATSDAAGTPAVISVPVGLQASGILLNVTRGANAAAVSDLNITAGLVNFGGNSFTKTGNGILLLSGNNTYTGATNLNAGTMSFTGGTSTGSNQLFVHGTIAAPAALRIETGASLTIAGSIAIGQITGDTNASLTIAGGTLASTGSASYFVIGDNNVASGGTASGSVIQTGGTLNLGIVGSPINYVSLGAANLGTYALSGGTINAYTANGFNIGDRNGATGSMTIGGTGTFNVFTTDGIFISKATSNTLTNGTLTLNTGATVNTSKITFGGAGSAGASVIGTLNLNGGTLSIGTGGMTETVAAVSSTTRFNGGTLKSSGAFSIGASMALSVDTGGAVIDTTGGSITSLSPLVLGIGVGNLTLSGGNTLTLPAGNTFLGTTSITGTGTTLKLSAATSLLNGVAVGTGAIFDLNGNIQSVAGLNDVAGAGGAVINSGTSGKTLILTGAGIYNFSGVYSGGINAATAGTSGLTAALIGGGSQTLSAAQLYTGATAVTAGTLRLDFSASGAPAANIINPTTNSSALTLGGGTLLLNGASGGTPSQRFNGLTLSAGSASALTLNQNSATDLSATLGTLTRGAQSAINFGLPTAGTVTASTSVSSVATGNIITTTDGIAYATESGTDWATNAAGTLGRLAAYNANSFGATDNADVTLDGTPAQFTAHTLRFNTAGKTLTLASGGAATLSSVSSGGILVTAASAGAGNAVTIAPGGANAQLSGAGGTTKELLIHNFGQLNVNVPIVNNGAATALTLAGTGTTTLGAANTYTGATAIAGGTTKITNLTALGTTAAGTTVGNAGTLDISVAGTIAGESLTLNGAGATGNGAVVVNSSGAWSGTIAIPTTSTLNVAEGVIWNLSNATGLSVTAGLTKIGTGTLSLTGGTSTGSGGLTVGAGVFSIPDNTAHWASGTIQVASGGTLRTAGSNTDSINAGVVVASGGTFDFQQTAAETLTSLTLNGTGVGGAGALVNNAALNTGALNLTTGTTLVLLGSNASIGVTNAANSLTLGAAIGGAFTLTKVGAGSLILTNNNNILTGAVVVDAGKLELNSLNNSFQGFFGASSVTVNNGATLQIDASNSLTGNGTAAGNIVPVTVNAGGTLAALTATSTHIRGLLTLRGGTVAAPSADASFGTFNLDGGLAAGGVATTSVISALGMTNSQTGGTFYNISPGATNGIDLDVTGTITSAGTQTALIKTGLGTMRLSGANTYTGVTNVQAGTIQFAKVSSLYNSTQGSWTKTNLIVSSGATLALNVGGTNEFTAANVATLLTNLTTTVSNNGLLAGSMLALDTANAGGTPFVPSSAMTNSAGTGGGAVGLTKLGAGTLSLSSFANSYTGPTVIAAGTLSAGISGALGSTASITVNTGGTLLLAGTGNRINDSAALFLAGTFDSAGLSETLGSLTLSANSTIDFGNLASVLSFSIGATTFANGATLDLQNWSGNPSSGGGVDQLIFAQDMSPYLSQIRFGGSLNAAQLALGGGQYEIVPVPEPATWMGALTGLGLIAYRERRRLGRSAGFSL